MSVNLVADSFPYQFHLIPIPTFLLPQLVQYTGEGVTGKTTSSSLRSWSDHGVAEPPTAAITFVKTEAQHMQPHCGTLQVRISECKVQDQNSVKGLQFKVQDAKFTYGT